MAEGLYYLWPNDSDRELVTLTLYSCPRDIVSVITFPLHIFLIWFSCSQVIIYFTHLQRNFKDMWYVDTFSDILSWLPSTRFFQNLQNKKNWSLSPPSKQCTNVKTFDIDICIRSATILGGMGLKIKQLRLERSHQSPVSSIHRYCSQ